MAGNRWRSVCTYLDIPNAKLDYMFQNYPRDIEEVFFKALCYWRDGKTSKKVKLSVLLEAMKEAGLRKPAEDLLQMRTLGDASVSDSG